MTLDWKKYPNFSEKELACKHTGKCLMRPEFMDILQQIRKTYNRPMIISSGYRDKTHPIEASKLQPGEHSYGLAVDVLVHGEDALDLIIVAYGYGIRRIGVQQKGQSRYIHLGYGDKLYNFPRSIWSY